MFNGKGPSEREAKELDRTVKSGTEDDAQLDPQLNQFVPDISRVNQSAGIDLYNSIRILLLCIHKRNCSGSN